jgi:acetyl-CoA synthetase
VAEKKLKRYAQECALFSWDQVRSELGCNGKGWMNIAHVALERHETGSWGNRVALRSISPTGQRRDITYSDFTLLADKFATALRKLGVAHGDRVFILGSGSVEMHVAILGALQNGAVVAPLTTNLGLGPIAARIGQGKGKVLVTTPELYSSKIAGLRRILPDLEQVIVTGPPRDTVAGTLNYDELIHVAPSDCVLPDTRPTDPAFLHYSTDRSGRLIGMEESHAAMLAHYVAGKYVLELRQHDVFWSDIEFGGSIGLSCGVVAPLLHGATCLIDEAEFEPARCYRILQDEKVNVWLTNPSVLRALKSAGPQLNNHYRLEELRHIGSAGGNQEELLSASRQLFGQPVHHTGWATETGRLMIAGLPGLPLKAGSLGLPLPGVEVAIVKRTPALGIEVLPEPEQEGELAIRCSSPDLLHDLLRNMHGTKGAHVGDYYLTGLHGFRDREGYFFLQQSAAGSRRPLEPSLSVPVREAAAHWQDNTAHI